MIVATAGHVDHGKSSLVKHLTGMETDTLAEEKSRGLSINLGFAYYRFQDPRFQDPHLPGESSQDQLIGFVDVPGHSDFINNMLAGVAAVDFALLVIAADDGIMPQTREHLSILDFLGVSDGVVVLTKIDTVEASRVSEVKKDIENLLVTSALQGSALFPVSNINGEGIPQLLSYLEKKALFYSHRSATNAESSEESSENQQNPLNNEEFRFSVDRVFTVKGIGTVVTGTVVAGMVSVDDKLRHSGSADSARIKGIRVHEQSVNSGKRGQRLALNINISHHQIKRGDWLLGEALLLPVSSFDALLTIPAVEASKINRNVQLHLHHFSSHRLVNVKVLSLNHDKLAVRDGEVQNSSVRISGGKNKKLWVNLKLSSPLYCLSGDRFIVRDASASRTIAGGEVVDIFSPLRGKIDEARLAYLNSLQQTPDTGLSLLLESLSQGLNYSQYSTAKNFRVNNGLAIPGLVDEGDESLKELVASKDPAGPRYVFLKISGPYPKMILHLKYLQEFWQQVSSALYAYHKSYPDRQGMSEFNLMKATAYNGSYSFFRVLVKKLLDVELIFRSATLLHIAGHSAQLDKHDVVLLEKLKKILSDAGITAPRTGELTELLLYDKDVLDNRLRELCEKGYLLQVFKNRFYLLATIVEIAGIVEVLADSQENGAFSVIQFRDESGIGRNLCIQLLEFFDRQGFTRRIGDRRIVRQTKESIFSQP